jgi:hypothetical protein
MSCLLNPISLPYHFPHPEHQTTTINQSATIKIALLLEDGKRMAQDFGPETSLWEALLGFEQTSSLYVLQLSSYLLHDADTKNIF